MSALLFKVDCTDQVYPPKSWKKFSCRSVLSSSRKTQKPLNSDTFHSPKNDVTEPKATACCNNQLAGKSQRQAFGNH